MTRDAASRYNTALTTSSITVNCPRGCRAARAAGESSGCVGVSTTAGDTAFTRIPLRAYSFASDVVAAIRPPSVIGQRRRNVDVGVFGPGGGQRDHVTAVTLVKQLGDDPLAEVKEAGHLVAGREDVVLGAVHGEGLGHEDSRVVDQRVHSAEVGDGCVHDASCGPRVSVVPREREDVGITRLGEGTRAGDYRKAMPAVGSDEARTGSLRCAGDDRDLSLDTAHCRAHGTCCSAPAAPR